MVTLAASDSAEPPLVRVDHLTKRFGAFTALDNVSLDVHSGEIVAVLGHNGSGKSTLVKVLAGIEAADGGEVYTRVEDDVDTDLHFIHQNLGLVQEFTAVENLRISTAVGRRALAPLGRRRERTEAAERLALFGRGIDLSVPVSRLAPAERSVIAIVRALDAWEHDRNVLVLDEPTESLHRNEVDTLFAAIRTVAARGAGVIFISHRLDEVLALADRIVVLRDGQKVADRSRASVNQETLVELIAGIRLTEHAKSSFVPPLGSRPALEVRNLRATALRGIDLTLHPGEIVGVGGVLGSGREEVPAAIFGTGAGTPDALLLDGVDVGVVSPGRSIALGIGYVPSDRLRRGSVPLMNATENFTLPRLHTHTGMAGAIRTRAERREMATAMSEFAVRPPDPRKPFRTFSGGNQQKIVLSKWLRLRPRVLLLEEPTQGVDIGAKRTIYDGVVRAAEAGTAVLFCSSDAKELADVCHRVIILRDGVIVGELRGDDITEANLIRMSHSSTPPTDNEVPT